MSTSEGTPTNNTRVSRTLSPEELEERKRIQQILQEKATTEQRKLMLNKLIHDISKTCFQKCVEKPGLKLSNRERNCVNFCASRYLGTNLLYNF
jgi:import inner membrane translocase subunit TIM8